MRYLGLMCAVLAGLSVGACKDKAQSRSQRQSASLQTAGKTPPGGAGVTDRVQKVVSFPKLQAAAVLRNTLNATVDRKESLATLPFYKLSLDIDYDLFTYAGRSSLSYINQEKDRLNELVFLVYPNSEELGEKGTQNLAIKEISVNAKKAAFTLDSSVLRIPLATPLEPGESVVVDMAFKGLIYRLETGSDDLKKLAMEQLVQMIMGDGAKKGGYGVFSVAKGIVSLGLWYPILAAYDKDGWDLEPGSAVGDVSYFDVANYDVSVTAPDDVVVVTTGAEMGRTVRDNRRQTQFSAGAVREFTIQMSRDYRSVSAVVDGVKVSSWYLAKHANSGRDILKYAKQALKLFNTEFGPYPYTELDVVEAPLVGGAGGVEFPGLVTVASMFYADDVAGPDADPIRQAMAENPFMKDTLEFVVAHEVAHEWWNAVVGSDSKT
ncbi:MAG TPA: hypothetical protein EYN66_20345, partial [Myxococcales bacterium]|nr:hypothetical protein [Myxococcales bacterium]